MCPQGGIGVPFGARDHLIVSEVLGEGGAQAAQLRFGSDLTVQNVSALFALGQMPVHREQFGGIQGPSLIPRDLFTGEMSRGLHNAPQQLSSTRRAYY